MAQRNPNWSRDELILALDLYLRAGRRGSSDAEVIECSNVLNRLPIHTVRPDLEKFRNPSGVALKLANFQALDPSYTGTGMTNGGRGDAAVWDDLHGDPAVVARLAAGIRVWLDHPGVVAIPEEDEEGVPEGRLLYRHHRTRERDRTIVAKKKAAILKAGGRIACEACGLEFYRQYGVAGAGYIECHHRVPLSESGEITTRLADLALLCANCHRVAHRARPWMSIEALRELVTAAPHA